MAPGSWAARRSSNGQRAPRPVTATAVSPRSSSSTEGAIGYVDLSDAKANNLTFASVKNKAGNYVEPTLEGTTAAAEGTTINDDLTFFLGWADGDDAYPIAAQTWIIAYTTQADPAKAEATSRLPDLPADRRPGDRSRHRLRAAAGRSAGEGAWPTSPRSAPDRIHLQLGRIRPPGSGPTRWTTSRRSMNTTPAELADLRPTTTDPRPPLQAARRWPPAP